MASTSPAEAAVRRLRQMLLLQRERLQRYLRVLEGQEQAILAEDVDRLEAYVQLEREVVEEIGALRRVIDPLEALHAGLSAGAVPAAAASIPDLKRSLERLGAEVSARNRRNCRLLEGRMEGVRTRLHGLARPCRAPSPFARAPAPLLVDISL